MAGGAVLGACRLPPWSSCFQGAPGVTELHSENNPATSTPNLGVVNNMVPRFRASLFRNLHCLIIDVRVAESDSTVQTAICLPRLTLFRYDVYQGFASLRRRWKALIC